MIDIIGDSKQKNVTQQNIVIKSKKESHSEDIERINREMSIIKRKRLGLHKNRKFFGKVLKRHIKTDRDYILACSGFEGEGKSACVVQIGMEINRCTTAEEKENFLKNNIVYDPKTSEFISKVNKAKKYSVIIVDEAHELLYKRNYNTKERKDLNTLFSKIRKKNLIIIFCIPDFFDLDKYFRNWRIKTWIYVPTRGIGIVLKKSNSPFSEDKWEQKRNQKIIDRLEDTKNKGQLLNKTEIIFALRKLKSHGLDFAFNDFDPVVKEKYLQYKEWGGIEDPEIKEKRELEEKDEKRKVKERIAQELFLTGKTTNEISDIMGISIKKVRDLVRPAREELKQKKEEEISIRKDQRPRPIIL